MRKAIEEMLKALNVDTQGPNYEGTPRRYESALRELLAGQTTAPPELKTFPCERPGNMVLSGPLKAVSLCPHHLLPFLLEGYFAYIPTNRVIGISKPGRLLKWVCGRFGLQEEIGQRFLDELQDAVQPLGAILILKGWHLCSSIRGSKQEGSLTVTCAASGQFEASGPLRAEFRDLIGLMSNGFGGWK